jgi:hypothetical protein
MVTDRRITEKERFLIWPILRHRMGLKVESIPAHERDDIEIALMEIFEILENKDGAWNKINDLLTLIQEEADSADLDLDEISSSIETVQDKLSSITRRVEDISVAVGLE